MTVRTRLELLVAHPSAMLLGAQVLQVLAWPFLQGSVAGRAFLGVIGMLAVVNSRTIASGPTTVHHHDGAAANANSHSPHQNAISPR